MYCRNANIAIVGFDVTRRTTLDTCFEWIEQMRNDDSFNGVIVAVGNKIDLIEQREVGTDEANERFASVLPPITYLETSAKTGENVNDVFETALKMWIEKQDIHPPKEHDNLDVIGDDRLVDRDDDGRCIIC